jgi:hypothetical protein
VRKVSLICVTTTGSINHIKFEVNDNKGNTRTHYIDPTTCENDKSTVPPRYLDRLSRGSDGTIWISSTDNGVVSVTLSVPGSEYI